MFNSPQQTKSSSFNTMNKQSHENTSPSSSTRVATFPARLHFMLSEMKRDGLEHIACWHPHGRSFVVKNPKEFESTILPCYFQQSKFTSFQRQLNFYGFRRISSGKDKGGYYHDLFIYGQQKLAYSIQRIVLKGQNQKQKICAKFAPIPRGIAEAKVPVDTQSNQIVPASFRLQHPNRSTLNVNALSTIVRSGLKSSLESEMDQRSLEIFQRTKNTPKPTLLDMGTLFEYNAIMPMQTLSSQATVSFNSFHRSLEDETNALAHLVTMRILDSRARSHLVHMRR